MTGGPMDLERLCLDRLGMSLDQVVEYILRKAEPPGAGTPDGSKRKTERRSHMIQPDYSTDDQHLQVAKRRRHLSKEEYLGIMTAIDENWPVSKIIDTFSISQGTIYVLSRLQDSIETGNKEKFERTLKDFHANALIEALKEKFPRFFEAQQSQEPRFPWPEPNWTDLLIARLGDIAIVAGRIVDQLREINEKL